MIVFPAQVLASVEHILQLLVGCIIDLSSEHLLIFCHLSLSFFSLYVCLIVQRTPLTLLPFALPRSLFRISCVVAAGAWEGGERYKGTSICRYLLDVPFHISPFGVEGGPRRGKLTLRLLRSRGAEHCTLQIP